MRRSAVFNHLAFALLTVTGAVGAQTVTSTLNVLVGGQPFPRRAVVMNGEPYVPLSALRAAGVGINVVRGAVVLGTPGGSQGRVATEGCLGEWLFDGVWRLRVRDVRLGDTGHGPGWLVTAEIRNGTSKTLIPGEGGMQELGDGFTLVTTTGNSLGIHPAERSAFFDAVGNKALPPAAPAVFTLPFAAEAADTAAPPTKLLVNVTPRAGLPFSATPGFRVNLSCRR